jgi:hypothetical protein
VRTRSPLRLAISLAILALALSPRSTARAQAVSSDVPLWAPLYASLLSRHTESVETTVGTTVDYPGLLREPAAGEWRELTSLLGRVPAPSTREEALALWINAYNILAIDVVLRHYPVESIRDIGSPWRSVWKRAAGTVAGREVSLHEIEHEILRPMDDPRIHSAIVCASTSCPSLSRQPYSASRIDEQLDEAMRRWLASPDKGLRIDRASRRIRVSQIFKWFREDFDELGDIPGTLRRYAPADDRKWLDANAEGASIDWFPYDWSLNRPR